MGLKWNQNENPIFFSFQMANIPQEMLEEYDGELLGDSEVRKLYPFLMHYNGIK